MMNAICIRISGRIGHFLKAEASASALSYPVPPRTVLLGMIGAILGLAKDQPQQVLEPAYIAVAGKVPQTHWHKAKLRKDPPEDLPMTVKKNQKQDKNTKPERATLISQEWLINPSYEVWASLPEPYHSDFARRVQERQWYFQPCLGLSEMLADIEYVATEQVMKLGLGKYPVDTVMRNDQVKLDFKNECIEKVALQLLQMPRTVTANRIFFHANYILERDAQPVNVQTSEAYQIGNRVVMFL